MDDANDRVTAAEIIRNFGYWQQQALIRPLTVTHHGRARTMLISTEAYERLLHSNGDETAASGRTNPLTALLDGMAECYIMHDADMRIMDLNAAAIAYFGKPREDLIGLTISQAMGQKPNLFIHSMLQRVLRSGEFVTYSVASTAFPGRRVSVRSFPYRNQVLTLFQDVTELEAMLEDALDWEAALTGLDLLGKSGVACVSLQGRVSYANAGFSKMTGLGMPELAGANFKSFVSLRDETRFAAALAQLIDKKSVPVLSVTLTPRPGLERTVALAISPLIRSGAVVGAMLVIAGDVIDAAVPQAVRM